MPGAPDYVIHFQLRGAAMKATPRRPSEVPQLSQVVNDWDKERKKLKLLSLVFVVILAVVATLVAISVIHGHI